MVEKRKATDNAGATAKKLKTEAPTRSSSRLAKIAEVAKTALKSSSKTASSTVKKATTTKKAAVTKKAATTKKAASAKKAATTKKATTANSTPTKNSTTKKAAPKKSTTAKKAPTKKSTTAKKAAPKKTSTGSAATKATTAKKAAIKKTTTSTKKAAPKKTSTSTKKAAPKKTATTSTVNKASAKKAAPAKARTTTTTKKADTKANDKKSTTSKKTVVERNTTKAAPNKTPVAKKATTAKKAAKKDVPAKETAAAKKPSTVKKAAPKKTAPKKAAPKKTSTVKKAPIDEEDDEEKEDDKDKEDVEMHEADLEKDNAGEKSLNETKKSKRKNEPAKKSTAKKLKKDEKEVEEDEKVAVEKVTEKASPKKASPKKASPKKASPKKASPKKPSAKGKGKASEQDFHVPTVFHGQLADVLTMGSGEVGQLGLQTIRGRKRPATLPSLTGKNILKLEVGGLHNFVIVQKSSEDPTDTEVYSWGCNDNKVLGRPTPTAEDPEDDEAERPEKIPDLAGKHIVDITTGEYHTAALAHDGTLYLWGSYKEQEGFLGYTTDQKKEQDLPIVFAPTKGIKFKQIASGHNHTVGLTRANEVLIWGYQITSDMPKSDHLKPHELELPTEAIAVKSVFAGGYCTFVITKNQDVYAMGINGYGQQGIGNLNNTNVLTKVTSLSGINIVQIAPGMHHTIALSIDGKVFSSGRGTYGQLGTGEFKSTDGKEPHTATFHEVEFFTTNGHTVTQIAGIDNHCVAVTSAGAMFAWGFGSRGQIGNATKDDEGNDAFTPFLVEGPQTRERKIYAAGAGGQHTALLASYPAPPKPQADK